MKKMVLIAVMATLVLVSGNTFAQEFAGLGLRDGFTLNTVSDYEGYDTGYTAGLAFGGYIQFKISENILIQQEMYYTHKGFTAEKSFRETPEDGDVYTDFELSTTGAFSNIELPLLLVVEITDNLKLLQGGYIDFCISARMENKVTASTHTKVEEQIEEETVTKWVNSDYQTERMYNDLLLTDLASPGFGLVFGIEYDLNFINIGARYTYGLTNIPEDKDESIFKHNAIQIMLGYPF